MPKRKITKKNHSTSAKSKLIGPVNELFLGSLIEHLPNMVFIKDALELRFVHFNKTGEELLGMTRDQLIGKNDYDFFPEDQAKFFVEKDRQVLKQGDVLLIPEEKIQTFSQGEKILRTRKVPLYDLEGQPTFLLGISEDITDEAARRQALEQAKESAEQANQLKSRFLAKTSHEIRTPMNGILGMTDLLRMSNLSEEQSEYVNTIYDSTQALLEIVNDLLDFSRIEAGKLEIRSDRFSPRDCIEGLCKLLQSKINQRQQNIIINIDKDVPQFLIGDSGRIRQILMNFITNAIKFTPIGGEITVAISTEPLSSGLVNFICSVKDTGIGIDPQMQKAIFDPFVQVDDSHRRGQGGVGLGLPICAELVNKLGGKIDVKSDIGAGSNFTFAIPILLAPTFIEETESPIEKANLMNCKINSDFSPKVLVVEDNATNQLLILRILEKLGCQVTIAENGLEAVNHVQEKNFDIVLMDVQMPVLDGLQATQIIRKLPDSNKSSIPILGISAHAYQNDIDKCIEAGMTDLSTKPIDFHDLIKKIKQMIARN